MENFDRVPSFMKPSTIFFLPLLAVAWSTSCQQRLPEEESDSATDVARTGMTEPEAEPLLPGAPGEEGKPAPDATNTASDAPRPFFDIAIRRIDKQEFDEVDRSGGDQVPAYAVKVTDFAEAQAMLQGRVFFSGDALAHSISKIVHETGKTYGEAPDEKALLSESFFAAYYPDVDVLLLEGGHNTDVAFDLATGEGPEVTGNPEYTRYSQDRKFRVMGVFGGQECIDYTLQVRTPDGNYREVGGDGEEAIPFPCVIQASLWRGDYEWFYMAEDYESGKNKYYRLEISEDRP